MHQGIVCILTKHSSGFLLCA